MADTLHRPFEEEAWVKALQWGKSHAEGERAMAELKRRDIPSSLPSNSASIHRTIGDTSEQLKTAVLSRRDLVDLVTGEKVVNIPYHDTASGEWEAVLRDWWELSRVWETLRQQSSQGSVDLSAFVSRLEAGPFPGFRETLSAQEQARLHSADADLCAKIGMETQRLIHGDATETIIPRITEALAEDVRPLLSRIANPSVRQDIADALELWTSNLSNPYRNYHYRAASSVDSSTRNDVGTALLLRQSAWFSIGLSISLQKTHAVYKPSERAILIHDQMNIDFLGTLILVHELIHAVRHGQVLHPFRLRGPAALKEAQERHVRYIKDPRAKVVVLEEEEETWAAMVELLIARIGFGTHDTNSVLRQLDILENSEQTNRLITCLLQFAQAYYGNARRPGDKFPEAYRKKIQDAHESMHNTCKLVRSPEGFWIPANV